ncbi:hypothetical protein K7432_006398 [Basidiobolus ranarum]|uniref:Uncharacterized protein n=1 Tax=Basidiobolus ranarum TaxID=34480 RepID=A0ABR2WV35_9FUNG
MKIPPKEVRGIGIHFTKLVDASIKDHQQPTIADFVKGRRHKPSDKPMQKPQNETTIVENESLQHPAPKSSDVDNHIELPDNQRELSSRDKAKSPNVKTSSDNPISPSIKKPKLTSSPNKVVQTKLNFTATTTKRTSTKLKSNSTSLLWSQVDLATFKELPPDIQKDVKRMYQIPPESEPPVSTEPQHTADSHAIENESEYLSKMDDSWDPEVFQQLPPEIRQEVIDEWKRHKLVTEN